MLETKRGSKFEGEYIKANITKEHYRNRTMPGCVTVTDSEQLTENVAGTQKSPEYVALTGITR